MDDRVEYIDTAKGIGILLVVIGHVVYSNNYPLHGAATVCNFIYSFHMPLFFIISGLCIKENKQLSFNTIKKMAKIYLIPYVVWSILYLLLFQVIFTVLKQPTVFSFDDAHFAHAISICGLAPLWFLLALFISEAIVLIVKPILKNRGGYWILCLLATITIISSLWYESVNNISLIGRNWLIGTLRIAPTCFFVLLGYLLREPIKKIDKLGKRQWFVIFVLIILQVILCWKWNECADVHVFIIGNPWLYFIKGINGSVLILLVSKTIHVRLFYQLGRKTKEIMILHYPPFFYTRILGVLLGKVFAPNIIGLIIITIVTIMCCLMIDWICSKTSIWNFVMGKSKSTKNVIAAEKYNSGIRKKVRDKDDL